MSKIDFKKIFLFNILALIILLKGCSPSVSNISLPAEMPKSFSDSGKVELPQKWWISFQNPTIDSLVAAALKSNFTLKSTWQRLRAAEAVVDRESASLFPSLEGNASGEIIRTDENRGDTETITLGLFSEYELDLWGRLDARVDAEKFRFNATFADYKTAAITLSAQIVSTYFQLVEASNQLRIAEEQVETNQAILDLLKRRFGTGLIRSVDILRQQQLLESSREQLIFAESNFQTLEHQMAVLLGVPPQKKMDFVYNDLPDIPNLPNTGLPVELVKRRPDVQSAYYLLRAADRDLAAAISDRYPRLSITASASTSANNSEDLFDNWIASVAGNLLAPIFYGGELSAEVDRTEAVKQQRLYEYGQTVLTAFQDVEDALIREKKQTERIESISRQYELANQAYEQLRVEYFNGITNYLDVLVALTEEQQLRRDLLTAKRIRLEYRIALHRALAGGFETDRESEENISLKN